MKKSIELKQLVGGALQEQFAKSFEKVLDNLQNPNTPFKNQREINIKLKFTQNENRDDVHCSVLVSEKLAPQSSLDTAFVIGKDLKTGEVFAEEYGKHITNGQMTLEESVSEVNKMPVDSETGELLESRPENVLDFRKIAAK